MKKRLWIIGIVMLVIGGIGVKHHIDQVKLHDEMIKIVKSDKAKKLFEEDLRTLDTKALTPQGIIKTYTIDYNSVKHNPMGGIMVVLKINNDPQLYVNVDLDKDTGQLEVGGDAISVKLDKRLEK
ncbi:hypothetical protein FC89_GL000538 [Liquorilactobacillus ghanensis DSM 18630]|uniref:DUF1310 family protein n=1 Tax=Liquorilactobacillus ghanensis DSM 18630 TaxID=1423750 RepID=A0A0R1VM50_9LACO|nr:DUF1310 family protein [Liquorilactobacillus ghanensis]KRM06397.1 hypothetical protein FC89_GL000538 [Liquorilactobacillus ghanensis DSM 18630]